MDNNLGWLNQYIEVGFFTDYRRQAWRYYLHNETTYAFLWLNSISYANLYFLREACPEAALLALLIRAEERLPAREAELPLLEHAQLAAQGSAGVAGASKWPLAHGLERLRRLAAEASVPEEYSVDIVMPYCDEPLDGLLSKDMGYDEEWLLTRVPLRHVGLVLYRLEVCAAPGGPESGVGDAAIALLPPRAAIAARLFRSVEVVSVDASPKAWEAARYLMHLARRYENLSDFTLFLHPDVFEHVNPRTLRNVLQALRTGTLHRSGLAPPALRGERWYEYLSLSHHYLTRPSRAATPSSNCTDAELAFRDLKRAILGEGAEGAEGAEATGALGDFGFYCCSQFMVHRDRVHLRPREWYQRIADSVPWEHCATSYMELLWHSGGSRWRGMLYGWY